MTDTLVPPDLDTARAEPARPVPPGRRARGKGRRATSDLPSGRALLGGLLVTIAAVGTYVAVAGDRNVPTTRYVVASRDVDAGSQLGPDDLSLAAIDLPDDLAAHAITPGEGLDRAVALAPLRAGALVVRSQVLAAPDGEPTPSSSQELSLRLPPDRAVAGTLNRGERVDVLATYGNGADATTLVVARDAVVTRLEHEETASLGDEGGLTLSLLLPDDETVLRATHAKDVAQLTLVRATRDGDAGPPTPGADADRYEGPTSNDAVLDGGSTGAAPTAEPAP